MYEQQFNPYAANLAVVKGYFKNGKVLALGILYILSAVVSAGATVLSALNKGDVMQDFSALLNQLDPALAKEAQSYLDMISSESISIVSVAFSVILSVALTILIAAAFISIYSKSKNEDPQATPLGGVNILYVLAVISMVFTIIGFVLGILCLVGLFFLIFFYSGDLSGTVTVSGYEIDLASLGQVLMPAFIFFAVIALIALIFSLVAVVNRKNYYSSVKESLTSVELQNKGAKGFGVICVICAVFTGFSLIGSVGSIFSVIGSGLSSTTMIAVCSNFVTTLLSFLTLVFEAGVALGYKRYIDDQKYGYRSNRPYTAVQNNFSAPVDNGDNPYADAPRQIYGDSYSGSAYSDNYSDNTAPRQIEARPMACPNCGAPLEEGSAFCGNCGTKL